jgi:predicted site-specific integrase-resolvase
MATKLLSVKECKEIYGLSRITVINYEKKGLIKPVRAPGLTFTWQVFWAF